MSGSLEIPSVTYHGGFSYLDFESKTGKLILDDEAVRFGDIPSTQPFRRNFDPPVELCRTAAVASIEVTSEQVAKSKLGAAMLFGVLGGVTAKGSADRATLLIRLKSGLVGYLTIPRHSTASLLGLIDPWRREMGIALGDAAEAASSGMSSLTDELAKLAQLRESGVLSEEEFTAAKAKLLG